jgi:hypothetical protein
LKFEVTERVKKEAAKKGLSGLAEAADTLIDTCDSRLVRNILSGVVKSVEDACHVELATKQVLSKSETQSKLPARVENIEQKQSEKEETGSISNSAPDWAKEDESQQETQGATNTTTQTVSRFND